MSSPILIGRCKALDRRGARAHSDLERRVREGRAWLLEHEGRPVACSSFNARIAEAVQVGGVWTPPELRSRGYGRAVVAATLLEARGADVAKAILFTAVDSLPAQKAYEALGFRHIGEYRLLSLKEATAGAVGRR